MLRRGLRNGQLNHSKMAFFTGRLSESLEKHLSLNGHCYLILRFYCPVRGESDLLQKPKSTGDLISMHFHGIKIRIRKNEDNYFSCSAGSYKGNFSFCISSVVHTRGSEGGP